MSENTDAATQIAESGAPLMDALDAGARLRHLLVNGDALNPNALDEESVDLTVTSPPYNVGKAYTGDSEDDAMGFGDYLEFTRQWLANCYAWTKPTGRICVNVSIDKNKNGKMPLSAHLTLIALQVGWKYHAHRALERGQHQQAHRLGQLEIRQRAACDRAGGDHHRSLQRRLEARAAGAQRHHGGTNSKSGFSETWSFNGESARRIGHEAPFPRELPKRCIKLFFRSGGDAVLDPFRRQRHDHDRGDGERKARRRLGERKPTTAS